jgi:hypothetical protein
MHKFYYVKFLIPAIVVATGIYYLTIPGLDPETKTFWKYLTFFALVIGLVRAWMIFKKKGNG